MVDQSIDLANRRAQNVQNALILGSVDHNKGSVDQSVDRLALPKSQVGAGRPNG